MATNMIAALVSLSSLLLTSTAAAPTQGTSSITWKACNETEVPGSKGFDCGHLKVPLDYSDASSEKKLTVDLLRVPAAKQPSLGSILFNFGGPGAPGRTTLAAEWVEYQAMTGGQYDLVSFDPRGSFGNTLPFICYDTELEAALNVVRVPISNASDAAMGNVWAQSSLVARYCADKMAEIGPLVNTAFTARDFMSVVDALDEDGMLRYWGISYGTNLGATIALMFPDRIDKIILDAVSNTQQYYHELADYDQWMQSDYAFSSIFENCIARPENCALAGRNASAGELEQATWDLLDRLKYYPIALIGLPTGDMIWDYSTMKGTILASLYGAAYWPDLAKLLDLFLYSEQIGPTEAQKIFDLWVKIFQTAASNYVDQSRYAQANFGIHCVDRAARVSTLGEFMPVVDRLYDISSIFGDGSTSLNAVCAQWQIEPKERYEGDFHANLSGPMLLLQNSGDAHCSIEAAKNVSSQFEGSELLVIDGFGHGAQAAPSSCTLRRTQEFWKSGTLPPPGTVCEVEAQPFTGIMWDDIFEKVASGNGTSDTR